MTARGSPCTFPGPVTGQASTHLPQRVQASSIASTRPERACSKVSLMGRRYYSKPIPTAKRVRQPLYRGGGRPGAAGGTAPFCMFRMLVFMPFDMIMSPGF